jgi:hypothetical protein
MQVFLKSPEYVVAFECLLKLVEPFEIEVLAVYDSLHIKPWSVAFKTL